MTTQPDANPLDLCDGHGTHVAGILAARDRVKGFEGVAPDVSLGVWRIFGCKGDTDDDIILAAAEMAADAGMDIINLSLGGGVSAWSEDALAVALSNLSKKGITVVVAQGNEGRDGIARTPSPAIGDQVISSGSADNTVKLAHIMHLFQNGHEITSFGTKRRVSEASGSDSPRFLEYVTGDGPDFVLGGKPQQLVLLPAGSEGDTACDAILKDIHDKIVVARRGDCDFGQKAMQVQNAGGSGIIVYSNPEEDSVSIDLHRYSRIRIPVVSISGEDGELLMNLYHETQDLDQPFTARFVSEQVPVKGGGLMSVFSTWGPDPELHLKPDIIGIGGHLYSTYPHTLGWYRSMSGTSMATPYISGCIALYMQATGERDPRNIIDHLINYAEPMVALHDETHLESVAKQGPGLIQLQDAILSSTHVYPSKISLNDTEHFKNSFTLFIENVSKEPKTYQVDHLPALAVNGYDFAKSSVPLEKATHLYVNASVQFDYDTVEINPFGSETLNVTFAQPVIDKSSKFKHLVYSGYIRLRQVDDDGEMIASKAIHVPYFGVLGNQRELPIFERGYPYIGLSNGRPILPRSKTKARVTYDFKRGDKVHLFLRLGSPSAQVRCEVFDRRNKWVGYIPNYENSWVARNDHSDEFFDNTISWHGQLSPDLFSKSAPISIQKGTYRIRVKALKIYGDPNVASDWENWTSFEFDVV
ncbi:peptidase S8/S53 domain-containing protein [Gongronella butleri]|nr:peptidase S8/S53 domain-containing protein [Gongronella butleri]